jgi:long-chain acyl-CoA synthetase
MGRFSIHESFAGKHILLTGGSGFVGKVWLAMALAKLPDIGRIYILLRGKGRGAKARFEKIMNTSVVFKPLHDKHRERLGVYVSERVEVVEGDVSLPGLGMAPEVAERLAAEVDLVVNFAGLVDFNPDLRDAFASNVEGALHVADFVERCAHASLLHVSTCYVAGEREGRIPEVVFANETPNGRHIDGEAEYEALKQLIADTERAGDDPETENALRDEVIRRLGERGLQKNERRVADMVARMKRKHLRESMVDVGAERARSLGWPNIYTYTKALAELLLERRKDRLRHAVFRPAIVESAMSFPFPGWNEGFNTSGPLVYLAGTWFRHIPARSGNPLDVIPVDLICNALFIVGGALLRNEHAPVYHCGSSDRNFLAIDRLTELSALGHRRHLRKTGKDPLTKLLLSRWDARASVPEHVLNVTNIRRFTGQVVRYLRHGLPRKIPSEVKTWADDLAKTAENGQRKLRQIEEVLELFTPFTYDHYAVFICRAIDRHHITERDFRFDPENIEWRSYWLETHMPGLRRWCFPEYENKEREEYRPLHEFRLLELPRSEEQELMREEVG